MTLDSHICNGALSKLLYDESTRSYYCKYCNFKVGKAEYENYMFKLYTSKEDTK